MIRRILLATALTAAPLGIVAAGVAAQGTAGASTPKPTLSATTNTCGLAGAIDFAKPGLSVLGTASSVTPAATKVPTTVTCAEGSVKPIKLSIASSATACSAVLIPNTCDPNASPPQSTDGQISTFFSSATGSGSGLSADFPLTISVSGQPATCSANCGTATTFTTSGSVSLETPTIAEDTTDCGSSVGFSLSGAASGLGYAGYEIVACLTGDTVSGAVSPSTADLGESSFVFDLAELGTYAAGGTDEIGTTYVGGDFDPLHILTAGLAGSVTLAA